MTNIAEVIGWKFNHQPGMSTREGVITEFPGGVPSQTDQDAWVVEYDAYMASIAYRHARAKSYSPVGDQLDVIWKWMEAEGLVPDTSESRDLNTAAGMLGAVKAVKAANPKGD
jgi:hypothetical protein